jgi:uncharacterized membrane protein YbaN (DUF454 family)
VKPIWFILAWLSFALGIIGAAMPVLPTTPFLILAAFLFSKSSPRFHAWLLRLPLAGEGIRDWNENRVIKPRAKILCSLMIFLSLGFMIMSPAIRLPMKVIVSLVLIGVWGFVVTRKSH